MNKIFVVVLNWNRPQDTLDCLKSISELRIKNYELRIVVVDNASSDNSVETIQKSKSKIQNEKVKFKIIKNEENLGFAGGNNVGIEYSLKKGADFVMVLNNDTVSDKKLIVEFLKASKKYPKAGIFSPKIYFAKGFEFHKKRYKKSELGKVLWYAGGKIDWRNVYGENRGVDEVDKGRYNKEDEIDFATGTCMFLRAQALRQIGSFDEKYFMYYEDVDLSIRMKKKGWKVVYTPKAILWHKVARSSRIGSDLNDYFIHRNRLLFGMRYAPMRAKFALFRESVRFMLTGRSAQKQGVVDFYMGRFGRGSWKDES